jgi:photosystem II stability/assembly factor-like uncharacterized protein
MKKLIFLFLLFVPLLKSQVQYKWINPSPTPYMLYDIFFLDSLTGWAVGEFSTVIKTTDGGKNWTHLEIPLRATLHRIYFADKDNGWIVGGDPVVPSWGAILKTTDGGTSWINHQPNPQQNYSFLDISMPSRSIGYIAGFEGIFKTTNSGINWINTGGTYWATSVFFLDSLIGWGTNPIGTILKTINGASSWDTLYNFHWKWHKRIKFYNKNLGWIVSGGLYDHYGTIYKTSDGGISWVLQDSSVNVTYYDLEIIDSLNAFVVGERGYIKYTTDGGDIWYSSTTNNTDTYFGISIKQGKVWVVGGYNDYPIVFETNLKNLIWKPRAGLLTTDELTAIDFMDKNFGYIAGYNGKLFYTSDGGDNWIPKEIFSIDFGSISIPDENSIFISGNTGELVKSTDAGETWIISNIRPGNSYYENHEVKFFSATNGYSFRQNESLLKTTDGGLNWNTIFDYADNFFFIDSLNGYVCVNLITKNNSQLDDCCGYILRTTDGGLTWSDEIILDSDIYSMFFIDLSTGWYSDGYSIYKTTDSGNTWDLVYNNSDYYIRQLIFLNDNEGYILGVDTWGTYLNTIFESKDGGLTFNPLKDLTFIKNIKIHDKTIFGVGSTGQIIKINRTVTEIDDIPIHQPSEFSLCQNYPNPFNPTTKIKYSIPSNQNPLPGEGRGGLVTLKVYDILGNEVATLVNEQKSPGEYEVEFDGSSLSSGIYFYQLKSGSFIQTNKMLLMK